MASDRKKNNHKVVQKPVEGYDAGLLTEIGLIILLALCLFIFISNFGIGGAVGNAVSDFFFGILGFYAYFFPVLLFFLVVFMTANKGSRIAVIKTVSIVFNALIICGMLHKFFGSHDESLKEIFANCKLNHNGGGLFGGLIAGSMDKAFGNVGTILILIALFIISLILITEHSIFGSIGKKGGQMYQSAREDAVRRKEQRLLEQEQEIRQETLAQTASPREPVWKKARTGKKRQDNSRGLNFDLKQAIPVRESDDIQEIKVDKEEDNKKDIYVSPTKAEPEIKSDLKPEIFTPDASFFLNSAKEEDVKPENIRNSQIGSTTPSLKSHEYEDEESKDEVIIPESMSRQEEYVFPPISLLKHAKGKKGGSNDRALQETARKLESIMHDFGVNVKVTDVSCGPTVTRFELSPEQGVKVSRIVALSDDIKLNLAVSDIRIEAPIPGKAAVGIEVPNAENAVVSLRELMESQEFKTHKSNIAFAAGKDISGKIVVADIAKMPHLLIAGATGSGKSVCINTIIMSILYKAKPDDVKLILIDPKVVELNVYNGIPHLYIPVVTDPKKASGALNWAVAEMTRRYQLFAEYGVRNLQGYNDKLSTLKQVSEENKPQKLPQIIIIVDELADLMMVAPGEVEDAICRLAQLARAAGLHLIIATQRPSVNVITGLIKANMPSRIAFAVTSGVDSRTILDMIGAEKLLGKGDMLFYPQGYPKPVRVQGAFVSDEEIEEVVSFITTHNQKTDYSNEIEEHINTQESISGATQAAGANTSDNKDQLFADAGRFIIEKDKASIGMLQRWFKIGFNRAARIMDQLFEAGVVGDEQGTKPREILMTIEQFEQYLDENYNE